MPSRPAKGGPAEMAAVDVSALFERLSGLRRAVELAEAAALDLLADAASRRQQVRRVEDALRALGHRVPAGLTGHRKTAQPGRPWPQAASP